MEQGIVDQPTGVPMQLSGSLPPMAFGAVATSASTIIVAANAQLLPRLRLGSEKGAPAEATPAARAAA